MNKQLSVGNLVKVIDRDEPVTEWATFSISKIKGNCFSLKTEEGKELLEDFWVNVSQITPVISLSN